MGFLIVRFRYMFLKTSSLNRVSQDFSYRIIYFPVAQKFIDFVIFTCFENVEKYRTLWKEMEFVLSAMI